MLLREDPWMREGTGVQPDETPCTCVVKLDVCDSLQSSYGLLRERLHEEDIETLQGSHKPLRAGVPCMVDQNIVMPASLIKEETVPCTAQPIIDEPVPQILEEVAQRRVKQIIVVTAALLMEDVAQVSMEQSSTLPAAHMPQIKDKVAQCMEGQIITQEGVAKSLVELIGAGPTSCFQEEIAQCIVELITDEFAPQIQEEVAKHMVEQIKAMPSPSNKKEDVQRIVEQSRIVPAVQMSSLTEVVA